MFSEQGKKASLRHTLLIDGQRLLFFTSRQLSSPPPPLLRLGKEPERNSIEDNDAEKQRRTVAPLESRSTRHLFCRRAAAVSVADENVFFLNPSLKKKTLLRWGTSWSPCLLRPGALTL